LAHRVVPPTGPAWRRLPVVLLFVLVGVIVVGAVAVGGGWFRSTDSQDPDWSLGAGVVLTAGGAPAPSLNPPPTTGSTVPITSEAPTPGPMPGPSSTIRAEDPGVGSSTAGSTPGSSTAESTPGSSTAGSPGSETVTAPEPPCPGTVCVSLVVTGDVLLHPPLWDQAAADAGPDAPADSYDFGPLLAGQRRYVKNADFGVCHLETPLAPDGGPYQGYPSFRVPPEIAGALADTGYDACSTASNHSFDDGTAGVDRTLDTLDAAGLAHNGTARTEQEAATPTLVERGGVTVGLVSGTYGLNGNPEHDSWQVNMLSADDILQRAAAARQAGADLVVVSLHAGVEYRSEPTAQQRDLAATLLASPDVDFVAGHHAHVVQPLEKINGKWVAYGLGNTVAAHDVENLGNREGLLVQVRFSRDAAGVWSTTDIAWVPSLIGSAPPYRWCSLIVGKTCENSSADDTSRARIEQSVNAAGAAEAGAHRLDQG